MSPLSAIPLGAAVVLVSLSTARDTLSADGLANTPK